MRILTTFASVAFLAILTNAHQTETTVDVLQDIYHRCTDSESMLFCVKPKVLAYITNAVKQDRLTITEDLAIVKSRDVPEHKAEDFPSQYDAADPSKRKLLRTMMLEKLDAYLSSHQLEAKLPEAIVESSIVPRSLVDSMPKSLTIPLSDSSNEQGRGFVKKVMIPFLLGLKFKATALVPLALGLIALKTWKALTLGLLSLVLSGAMILFKLTKPKIAYEVVHYGHPPIEHPPHWDNAAHGPYRAYRK
ncbi:PREDICTED: uncharacterized protein LOC108781347 [Cyphomyrmex costatus]|uniref:Osiris 18 n=1 Tax=Cyphomyrmex costatus TaxID=456900 RepID=A0A195C1C7_9HYME|nr:PREDICTED: uncharacterized protein LOC108781347 [Cyphomyrmex costatus]KYM94420.1 hypothetical protein ALC62_14863 [Cyphomyrmex costatus]